MCSERRKGIEGVASEILGVCFWVLLVDFLFEGESSKKKEALREKGRRRICHNGGERKNYKNIYNRSYNELSNMKVHCSGL